MTKLDQRKTAEEGDIRDEYDFSKGRPNPYAARARAGMNLVMIEPDLFQAFPTSEAVNAALRQLLEQCASGHAAVELPKAG